MWANRKYPHTVDKRRSIVDAASPRCSVAASVHLNVRPGRRKHLDAVVDRPLEEVPQVMAVRL